MSYYHFENKGKTFDSKLKSSRCEQIKSNGEQCKNRVTIIMLCA